MFSYPLAIVATVIALIGALPVSAAGSAATGQQAPDSKIVSIAVPQEGLSLGAWAGIAALVTFAGIAAWLGLSSRGAAPQPAESSTSIVLGAESYLPFAQEPTQAPQGLDREGVAALLITSKDMFLRLQQAWDQHDMATAQTLITQELFGQIHTQMDNAPINAHTGVEALHAVYLGHGQNAVERVEFSGLKHEDFSGVASPFREIWSMKKIAQQWHVDSIERFDV